MLTRTLLLAATALVFQSSDAAKILLVPSDHGAHVNFNLVVGRALAERGHQVHILTVERNRKATEKFNIPGIVLAAKKGRSYFETNYNDAEEVMFRGNQFDIMRLIQEASRLFVEQCKEFLEDNVIMNQLESEQFDLMILDGAPPSRCMYIIAYRLGVKYITLSPLHDPWMVRVPTMPSAEPAMFAYFAGDPSFIDILKNILWYTAAYLMAFQVLDDGLIEKYAPNKPKTTFEELYLNSELWLVTVDNVCMDNPRIFAPHYQYVGGINAYPANPLPKDLEDFIDGADKGIILMTFGSGLKRIPEEIMRKLMKAFAKIDQKVILRHDGVVDEINVSSNVKIAKWLPQNDILGHNKTRLFITHAGNNGQLEALYHGVPMLSMPVSLDQNRNALRSEYKGYGKTVNPFHFETEELLSTINLLLENSSYRENIQQCSAIFRDFPSPRDTVVFYVEHVLKFGGAHLKPAYLKIPLWKLFMLDVLAFFWHSCCSIFLSNLLVFIFCLQEVLF